MTLLPPGVKVHLALSYIDMRKGIDGLAMLVQGVLRQDRRCKASRPSYISTVGPGDSSGLDRCCSLDI